MEERRTERHLRAYKNSRREYSRREVKNTERKKASIENCSKTYESSLTTSKACDRE
jgi:hypothetical protein